MKQSHLQLIKCLNCDEKVDGNFCQNCGQSTSIHRITFRETFGDFFSSTFALEGPLLSTIKLLITNPGSLFRNFINGKRKTYYKPVAFFVVVTAVYLIIRAVIDYDPLAGQANLKNESLPEQFKKMAEASKYMVRNINNIMFFLVLAFGLMHKLFFWRKYYLAEYVTVGFYVAGIYTLLGTIQMLISVYVISIYPQIALLILFCYQLYASISFYQNRSFLLVTKCVFASILATILYAVLGYGFSYLMVY